MSVAEPPVAAPSAPPTETIGAYGRRWLDNVRSGAASVVTPPPTGAVPEPATWAMAPGIAYMCANARSSPR